MLVGTIPVSEFPAELESKQNVVGVKTELQAPTNTGVMLLAFLLHSKIWLSVGLEMPAVKIALEIGVARISELSGVLAPA